jgi:hypothetical protein
MSFNLNNFSLSKSFKLTGAIALLGAAVVLPACSESLVQEDVAETPATEEVETDVAAADGNVQVEDLTENLESYLGQTVTVREEIEEVVGESGFFLEDDELFGGEQVLVINASGEGIYLVEGDDTDVQVTGEVVELIVADLETEYGIDLDPELYAEYEQQPVIIAQSLALAPDPNDLSRNPEQYYNQRIAVNGEVEDLWSTEVMSIDGDTLFGEDDLLVISPNTTLDFAEDEEVVMTGVLRPLVTSEIDQEYELTWDLDLQEQIEAEYQERPVFVADEIYPSAM